MMRLSDYFPASGARSKLTAALLAGVLSVSLAGCATKGDLRDVQTEIRELAVRQEALLTELERQNRVTMDTLRNQSDELLSVRGNVSQQLRQVVDRLETLTELTGQNQQTIAAIRDQLIQIQSSAALARRPSGDAPGGSGGDGAGSTMAAEEMYNTANRHFQRGSITPARMGFQQFLQAYPSHELSPLVHARLADLLVQEDRLEEAIDAFERIPELFPQNPEVPHALYRIGVLHVELGEPDEARRYFQRVINTWPDGAEADLARDRLEELGGD